MSLTGELSVTFTSDWHCGTGQGRYGGIDRLIRRDLSGLPFVPAKTLLGLWRDACEKAATGLDDGTAGEWSKLVERVFGAPPGHGVVPDEARGLLSVEPARLPLAWRSRLTQPDPVAAMLRAKLTTTRFGVKIDDDSGVAADDTLRLIERARTGLTVETTFRLPITEDTWPVELLLQAGARLMHHVGASRRRGAGRCTVRVTGLTGLPDLLAAHATDVGDFTVSSLTLGTQEPAKPPENAPAAPPSDFVRCAEVTIDTFQPMVTTKVVRGNVATGYDFLPGASVLPLIAAAIGPRATGLIRQGHLTVTDATLAIDGAAFARAPLSLLSGSKGEAWRSDGILTNFLTATQLPLGAKPVEGWAAQIGAHWSIAHVALDETAHANVDDATQRPDEDGLYTLEAIPAGTSLKCVVRASSEVTDDEWGQVLTLDREQAFGRYRRSDFGAATVSVQDAAPETIDQGDVSEVALWLTSDACLVDDDGLPDPTPARLASELAQRLGVTVAVGGRSTIKVARRESWTTNHTLPRDTRVVLSAGSVIPLVFGSPVALVELHQVLRLGVGTLRTEGFGQLRLLPAGEEFEATMTEPSVGSVAGPKAEPTDVAWGSFVAVAWRETLAETCVAASADATLRDQLSGTHTSNAARGSLREAARQLASNPHSIERWVAALGTGDRSRRTTVWGDSAVKAIERIGATGVLDEQHQSQRLAWLLNIYAKPAVTIPDDLAGVNPVWVAQLLIEACLSQVARVGAGTASEEGAA